VSTTNLILSVTVEQYQTAGTNKQNRLRLSNSPKLLNTSTKTRPAFGL
jgi:hypothetical protein